MSSPIIFDSNGNIINSPYSSTNWYEQSISTVNITSLSFVDVASFYIYNTSNQSCNYNLYAFVRAQTQCTAGNGYLVIRLFDGSNLNALQRTIRVSAYSGSLNTLYITQLYTKTYVTVGAGLSINFKLQALRANATYATNGSQIVTDSIGDSSFGYIQEG